MGGNDMNDGIHQKIQGGHLKRDAYLYVRQSTIRQVFENTESTKRQYALRQRATALGWPAERIIVIDNDLGRSGEAMVDREGFQKLVAEVGMGHAGIVLGLEVSRLARNCADWHRLLELCALAGTLILDEDGLYDPRDFNDRLLLGLKGTMSEAELHILRARLQGGKESKARRGELRMTLPIGLVYDPQGHVALDPDQHVQQTLRTLFQTFQRTGSAGAVVRFFRAQGLLFPYRLHCGARKGEVVWRSLGHDRVLRTLHHPRYAGAYVYGRMHVYKTADGRTHSQVLPQDQWHTLLLSAHPGYITWEQFQDNRQRLHAGAQAQGKERSKSPPGRGPALLQGLVLCGICGLRMTVRYRRRKGCLVPEYICQKYGIEHAQSVCQFVPGAGVDQAISSLLLEMVTPMTLDIALAVQQELQSRLNHADQLRKQQVERAQYEADLAGQRFMQVHPNNRHVADTLEADWNEKLRILADAKDHYEQQRQADRAVFDQTSKAKILSLATDFPKLWQDPQTTDQDRKRMVRLLVEDVTLIKKDEITAQIRFRGGATRTLTLPKPIPSAQARRTPPAVVSLVDQLLDDDMEAAIAIELDRRGYRSGTGQKLTPLHVARIRRFYKLKSHGERLREAGMLTQNEIAKILGTSAQTVIRWREHGLLRGRVYNSKREYLYEPVGENRPVKNRGQKLSERRRFNEVVCDPDKEVQYEA
jgi:DNA invertase Pin-like site-specific DNA recombinase